MSERVDPVPEQTRPFARSAGEARAEPVVDGVVRLVLPLPYTETATVNAFLLERREGWCLVDCGSSVAPGWEALEHALGCAGVEPAAIELLVCTHAHADHYGLAAEVVERCGCPLALAPGAIASADWIRDPPVPLHDRLALARRAGVPPELEAAAVGHPGDDGLHPRPGAGHRPPRGRRDRDVGRRVAGRAGTRALPHPGRLLRGAQRHAPLR